MGVGAVSRRSRYRYFVEIGKAHGCSDGPVKCTLITYNEMIFMMEGYGFGHGYGLGHGFGILFWILILVFVVVAAGFILRGFGVGTRSDTSPSKDKSPLEILETRYARGEIEHDEFKRRKRDLQDRNNGP